MPTNEERRARIADAAVTILARDGLRGLTHRAVDAEAGLPQGTTSNYHRTRRSLLQAAAGGTAERLGRVPAEPVEGPRAGRESVVAGILGRVDACLADREALVAWFELRLLAAREPGLDVLTAPLAERHQVDLRLTSDGERPGSDDAHRRLLHALDGILLAAASGSTSVELARADAESLVDALVPPDTPQRRWFNLR